LKPHWKTYTVPLLVLLCAGSAFAQFNLNKFNGLPSNHVYMFLKDRYGYLWIATDKGVLRYNGYEVKLLSTSQELGSNDVWRLYLDRKERMWLFSFSSTFGYIYNDRYYKVIDGPEVINPNEQIYETDEGLFFPNRQVLVDGANIDSGYLVYRDFYNGKGMSVEMIDYNTDRISLYEMDGYTLTRKKECPTPPGILPPLYYGIRKFKFNNHVFIFTRKKNRLVHLDLNTCRYRLMLQENGKEGFSYMHKPEGLNIRYLYMYYEDHVDRMDSALNRVKTFSVSSLTNPGVSGYDLVYLLEDSLWGKCVATESNGGFISPFLDPVFRKKQSWDAQGFSFLSSQNDSIGYWWNEQTHTLAREGTHNSMLIKTSRQMPGVQDVLPFDSAYDIVLMRNSYYSMLDKKNGKLGLVQTIHEDSFGVIRTAEHKWYVLSNREMNVVAFGRQKSFTKKLLNGKFKEVVKDPVNDGHWVYNQHNLYFINMQDSCIKMNNLLRKLGIVNLEKLLVDALGNMLLMDRDRLISYNPFTFKTTELLPHCNLLEARLALSNNVLVAAGKFGVAFIRITPSGTYLAPFIYHNIKNNYYAFVNDLQVLKNEVILQTDAGTYTVVMPAKDTLSAELPCHLLLKYSNSMYTGPHYMINLEQQNNVLQFDLVRPAGNGTLKYKYRIDGIDSSWKELNANELVLPLLEADEMYTLSIMTKDDVWKSGIINIQIYVKPYWWQSSPGVQIIWILGLLITAGILFLTAITTRNLIEKRNARHRQLLELELKAIYAQINPHFIFNTLNSGLHFIKKQKTAEAYQHILRFSQLLRAYLKASRHRYITLAEEITNLSYYIELQQTRFAHIFDYTIHLDHISRPELISIPSLLLQPIVENAIEHGLLPSEKQGHLDIRFTLEPNEKQLTCTISDNGIGRRGRKAQQQQIDQPAKTESYGDNLIKELITLFNKYEKMGIEISYEDLPEPNTGTIVRVLIKNPHLV
jgi:two-component sensor histidine kinase